MSAIRGKYAPVRRALGLGAAQGGTHHWWTAKLTAIALIPLGLWLVASVIHLAALDRAGVLEWLRQPAHGAGLILFLLFGFHHSAAGLQTIMEDYLPTHAQKLAGILVSTLLHLAGAAFGVYAVIVAALRVV